MVLGEVVSNWDHRTWDQQRGRSRNKVAVGEPAAGSPPLIQAGNLSVKGHVTKRVCTMQFSVGYSGDEGLSERVFAMTVTYRINLHLATGC